MSAEPKRRGRLKVQSGPRLRAVLLALVAVVAAGLALAAYASGALSTQELSTVDARFSIRGAQRPPRDIVVVKIDATTFDELNQQWPFERRIHAKVIDRIAAQHPAAIAYDVQFSEPSTGSAKAAQSDEVALLTAISNSHRRTVFSTTETERNGDTRFLGSSQGTKLLHEVGSRAANGLFPDEGAGGVIRHMSYSIGGLNTLAVAAVEVATHRPITPAEFGGGHDWIDFRGPAGTFPSVSFSKVYDGQIAPGLFHNKIVVIGATAPSLQDIHATPVDALMSGPELQANAISSLMGHMRLFSVPSWVDVLLIVLMALAVPLLSLRAGPVVATAAAVLLGVAFSVGIQLAFNAGAVASFVYPIGALVLSATGALATQLVTEAFERIRVRDMFTRFVPEDVVDELLASSGGLRLGGVQREGTVMFSDLRGFTSMAETLAPARVIEVLNRYLSEMSDAILDHGGTLVAYMGDGIMAVYGAPLAQEDHADRALRAAREMVEVRLPRFNRWLASEQLSEGGRMGSGLNRGHVMGGHGGAERGVESPAGGDTTNTASRIEALTKGTPHQLYLSGQTKDALRHPPADLVHVGETDIRGRNAKLVLWTVADPAPAPDRSAGDAPVSGASPTA